VYPDSTAYVDWDLQGHRLVSTFLDPNFAGALIAVLLVMMVARLAFGIPVPAWKLVLLGGALCMTISRGAFMAFFAGALFIVCVRRPSRRLVRTAAITGAVMLPALPGVIAYAISYNKFEVDASALTRVVSWLAALETLRDHWLIGVGFNTYGFAQRAYGREIIGTSGFGLDGGLLFVAVMTGVVGVVLYVGMLGAIWRRARRTWRNAALPAESRALALGAVAAAVVLLVQSAFLNSLLYPFLMETAWVVWGLASVAARGPAEATESDVETEDRQAPRGPVLLALGGVR
jgi:O-antigen ligase